jgi:hypothetical protein
MINLVTNNDLEKILWTIPVSLHTLKGLGYKDLCITEFSKAYNEYVYYFLKDNIRSGFVLSKNDIMFPTLITYKKVTEGKYVPYIMED